MSLVSFDIFDTALIRKCGKPENVFWIMAKELFPDDRAQQCKFFLWRETINDKISQKNVNYTLEDLYKYTNAYCFQENGKIDGSYLRELEYSVEAEMLAANPSVSNLIETHRNNGDSIAFVSDMYLNSSFLRGILIREKLFKEGDKVYVSCECKARKDDGSLFLLVRSENNPSKWIHYGDNKHSDYAVPKKLGIESHHVEFGYSRIEQSFWSCSEGLASPSEYSILMGYLRYLRLTSNNTPEDTFAIDFIAPLYYGYVKHVVDDAKRRGIKTLYFLSRDSYIFMKIAEQIPHEGILLRYLYVSRKSIQPAFRYIVSDAEYKVAIKETVADVIRDESDKDSFELLDAYFEQEGMYDENIALVDLGWFGSTRLMINKLRAHRGTGDCFSYYLCVIRQSLSDNYGPYDSLSYSEKLSNNSFHTFILEEYFSLCPHPTVLGYKKDDSHVVPVFGNDSNVHTNTNARCCEVNVDNCCRFARLNIRVELPVLLFYGLNVVGSIDYELEKPYIELLFNVCRNENFLFRRMSFKDFHSFVSGRNITINDTLAFEASFDAGTKVLFRASRKSYYILYFIFDKIKNAISRLCL